MSARAAIMAAAMISGCIQVGPKDLNIPTRGLVVDNLVDKSCECQEPNEPPQIPEVVHISIEPGKPVEADAGGEALLRAYIAQREWALRGKL